MNADGTNDTPITVDGGTVLSPSWSPDDNRIIYTSFVESFSDLYIMNSDGSEKTKITDSFHDEAAARWGVKR